MLDTEFSKELLALRPYLLKVAHRRSYKDVEDVVQETLVKGWRFREHFRGQCSLKTWLITILDNSARDMRRRSRAGLQADVDLSLFPDTHSDTENLETRLDLQRAMHTLPGIYRQVFLQYAEGAKYEDIQARHDIPLGTVKSRLKRARNILRERLTK